MFLVRIHGNGNGNGNGIYIPHFLFTYSNAAYITIYENCCQLMVTAEVNVETCLRDFVLFLNCYKQ